MVLGSVLGTVAKFQGGGVWMIVLRFKYEWGVEVQDVNALAGPVDPNH